MGHPIDTRDGKGYIHDDSYVEIDKVKERKLVRKLDLHIVPVVMLLYLLVQVRLTRATGS
jgi:hypothetical protein